MRRYATFSGRSTRSQFWLFTVVYMAILIVAAMLDGILMIDPSGEALIIAGIVSLVHLIPSFAVLVRRLHDTDRSGWWILTCIVPPVGLIVLTIFACTASTGPNRFGLPVGQHAGKPAYSPAGGHQAPPAASHLDQLEKLAALRSSGAIDDGEFERMKADLLANPRA